MAEEGLGEVLGGRGGSRSGLGIIISVFFQKKTMHRPAFGLVSSLISVVVASAPSQASPFVYTTGGLLNADLKTCMADAKGLLPRRDLQRDKKTPLTKTRRMGHFLHLKQTPLFHWL